MYAYDLRCLMAGCVTAVVGCTTVPIDRNDDSPPVVTLEVPGATFLSGGDVVVSSAASPAELVGNLASRSMRVNVTAVDPQGVRFVELMPLQVTPWCRVAEGGPADVATPGPDYTLEGMRNPAEDDRSYGVTRAGTRIPVSNTYTFFGEPSSFCPADRPNLRGARVRMRARADNFGPGGPVETAEVTIYLASARRTGPGGGSRAVGGGGNPDCPREGQSCQVRPEECFLREDDFEVTGRYVCRNGSEVCSARVGVDYCAGASCNEVCGACQDQSCTTDADCSPTTFCNGRTCSNQDPSGFVCGTVNGRCWRPNEVDNPAVRSLICRGE